MKRPKCPRCQSRMYCEGATKERRDNYGPFGFYYIAHWFCGCGHRNNPRVSKAIYKTLRAEVLE